MRTLAAGSLLTAAVVGVSAQPLLAPIAGASSTPSPPWRTGNLPQQTHALTRFEVVDLVGVRASRIGSGASYGNPLRTLEASAPATPVRSWRWRLERAIEGVDLGLKAADDAAARICVVSDQSIDRVSFVERQMLRMARVSTGQALPAASLCSAWDPAQVSGTVSPDASTRRMRWLVLQGAGSAPGAWRSERRELRADFLRAFGDEASEMPRITAVLVGFDADHTGGQGIAYLADLALQ